MARIGILAYGSLIGQPGDEIDALEVKADRVRGVRTPFPVEFARSSVKRGGAPSLVPFADGACVPAEIIVIEASEKDAKDMLWRRETNNKSGGYTERAGPGRNALYIRRIENFGGLPLVLAAEFSANIENLSATKLAELAIASAKQEKTGRDGIAYLIGAKSHNIETPLSPAYEAEILRLTGAATLEAARAGLISG